MVKTIITIAVVFIILSSISIFEGVFIKNEFKEFNSSLSELYTKIEEEKAKYTKYKAQYEEVIKKINKI